MAYYPDIQLCDDNCELISVFLNNLTANCDCPISEEKQKDKIKNNAFYQYGFGQYEEFLYLTNINVIKCYKDIFKSEYFKKAYGGFIILGLILIKILCTVLYFKKNKSDIKKYIYSLTNNYLNFIRNQKSDNEIIIYEQQQQPLNNENDDNNTNMPNQEHKIDSLDKINELNENTENKNNINSSLLSNNIINKNIQISNSDLNNKNDIKKNTKKLFKFKKRERKSSQNPKEISQITNKLTQAKVIPDNFILDTKNEYNFDIEDFLRTNPEDMEYDDAIRRDKRTFLSFLYEKIKSDQIILNTFFYKENLRPLYIKIILFVLQIDLYFFINRLFFNEDYVNEIFELEEDTFSKVALRFIDNLFYAFLVGVIINYIIEFFFIPEKKLRTTLKRAKDNLLNLKDEMMHANIENY